MDNMLSRRGALQLLAAAAAVHTAHKFISRLRFGRRFDGLEGIVSFSSRIIAAWRALETDQVGALFCDPLAKVLAGRTAMQQAENRAAEGHMLPEALQRQSGRRLQISHMAIRTVWFDRELLAALGADSQPQPLLARLVPDGGSGGVKLGLQRNAPPRQVVLLGAGMDTRAWRLNLPPGIRWFEVDRADVLGAKRATMATAGATFEAESNSDAAHPLRAASYAALEADVGVKGWTADLAVKGFDRLQPTVWVAEGLLMYLQPAAALTMLQEIADASAPGSAFLSVSVTKGVIDNIRLKHSQSGSSLISQFVWGCPEDPSQLFMEHGWRVCSYTTRQEMVGAFGLDPSLTASIKPRAKGYKALFIVATPAM